MIETILSKLNSIPADKVMHFASGVILYAGLLPFVGSSFALSIVVLMAVGKEVYDSYYPDKHTADVWDAVATILGGLLGLFISLV
jgi:VanZ family protein